MQTGSGQLVSREKFGDIQLHVEWSSPNPPVGTSQGRGNSGILIMGLYEIQVLDMYNADKPELVETAGPGPTITDDFPYVEYFRSLPQDDLPDTGHYSRNVAEILR